MDTQPMTIACINASQVDNICTDPGQPICFNADPDVAGIGVITSFVVSSYIAFVALTIVFVSGTMPKQVMRGLDYCITNPIIKLFTGMDRTLHDSRPHPLLERMHKAVLFLGDQQLIMGTAIFVVSFIRFNSMTQYHFRIASLLGQMAFLSSQAATITACRELKENAVGRAWRVVWIAFLAACSIVSTLYINDNRFMMQYGTAVSCVTPPFEYSNSDQLLGVVTASLLAIWGLGACVAYLYPGFWRKPPWNIPLKPFVWVFKTPEIMFSRNRLDGSDGTWGFWDMKFGFGMGAALICNIVLLPLFLVALARKILIMSMEKAEKAVKSHNNAVGWFLVSVPLILVYGPILTLAQIFISCIVDILRILAMLIHLTYWIKERENAVRHGLQGNESTWEFGQVLAMILLAGPLLLTLELLLDKKERETKDIVQNLAEDPQSPPLEEDLYKSRWFQVWTVVAVFAVFGLSAFMMLQQNIMI